MDQSAAYGSGYALGTIVGTLLFCGGLLWLGIAIGNWRARRRGLVFVRWPVGVAFALILLTLAGQCAPKAQAPLVAKRAAG